MVWPHYGWLLYGGSSSPDIKQLPTCRGSHHYLEGTIYYSSLTTKASLEESAIQLVSKASTAATQLHIDLKSALLRVAVLGYRKISPFTTSSTTFQQSTLFKLEMALPQV